jgi:hypothetical protein
MKTFLVRIERNWIPWWVELVHHRLGAFHEAVGYSAAQLQYFFCIICA